MIAVNTDASYREDLGRAGIAYCGGLGRSSQVVDARDTMHAEMLAIALAMSAAHARGVAAVTFRHDAMISLHGASRMRALVDVREFVRTMLANHPDWRLKRIPRESNVEANVLCRRALKLEIGSRTVKAHCEDAARRELEAA